jgi:hypothetical protein
MASVIYGVQINKPGKRKLNPAAPPKKARVVSQKSVAKICGANVSFAKKKSGFRKAPVEIPVIPAVQVEIPSPVIETTLKIEEPVENPKTEGGWKAKREKKKSTYGLKEDPEAPTE